MSLFRRSGLGRFSPAQSARGMRALATAMLAGMAAIFIAATHLDHIHPAWGFVRAFAEAGLVGGIADWFAVTALFRHPLGLPIPHTAIIRRNKDRIGDTRAQFLKDNFLTPSVVARRMKALDVSGAIGRFLSQPPGAEGRLRQEAADRAGDVDALHPPRHHRGGEEIVLEEQSERVADPVLVARNDRGVRNRQPERMAEQGRHREPVCNATDQAGLCEGAHEAPGGMLHFQPRRGDEDRRHAGQHRRRQRPHGAGRVSADGRSHAG